MQCNVWLTNLPVHMTMVSTSHPLDQLLRLLLALSFSTLHLLRCEPVDNVPQQQCHRKTCCWYLEPV